MTPQEAVAELKSSEEFFERSSRCLTEDDSASRPTPDMYTVAQQVAHAARTVDWFVEGATRPEGFDMDFERHVAESLVVTSLAEAGPGLRGRSKQRGISSSRKPPRPWRDLSQQVRLWEVSPCMGLSLQSWNRRLTIVEH
jgi:hypothetical protein